MSVISEGPQTREHEPDSPLPRASRTSVQPGNRPAGNGVRASQARAALLRAARRDEQAVAHWLRELARPHR